jgi:hypothetical protein
MNSILKLLLNDYQNAKSSDYYKLVLNKACETESKFLNTLSKEQKAEYLKLDFVFGELCVAEQNEFAEYLYKNLVDFKS